jgi:hypothetical protein
MKRFNRALPWGGLVLVALGVTVWPVALSLGWAALVLAFFAWVAEWNGIALPRPGLAPIRTVGCWETPFAFIMRRRGAALLFTLDDDPVTGAWSDAYTVREQPDSEGLDPVWELPVGPHSGWSMRGRVPVDGLRFEHHERVCYVERGSLERALASAVV